MLILRCVACKTHKRILCKKVCRPCYWKAYNKKNRKRILYNGKEYPL